MKSKLRKCLKNLTKCNLEGEQNQPGLMMPLGGKIVDQNCSLANEMGIGNDVYSLIKGHRQKVIQPSSGWKASPFKVTSQPSSVKTEE